MIAQILATLACGVFTGAALYISFVEQPARLSCGIAAAMAEWKPSYRRGTTMQASLAIAGSVLALTSWVVAKDSAWLLGGLLLLAVVPFTLLAIFPVNKVLESSDLDVTSQAAEALLRRWGSLHAVRGALSLVAFVIFLLALQHKS